MKRFICLCVFLIGLLVVMPPGPVKATTLSHQSFVADHPFQAVAIQAVNADQTPILIVNRFNLAAVVAQEIGGVKVSVSEVIGYNKGYALLTTDINYTKEQDAIKLPDIYLSYSERLCTLKASLNLPDPESTQYTNYGRSLYLTCRALEQINIQNKVSAGQLKIRSDTLI